MDRSSRALGSVPTSGHELIRTLSGGPHEPRLATKQKTLALHLREGQTRVQDKFAHYVQFALGKRRQVFEWTRENGCAYDKVALGGRFLSIDPVTTDANTGGSFNRYAYANNGPYKYIDLDALIRSLPMRTPDRASIDTPMRVTILTDTLILMVGKPVGSTMAIARHMVVMVVRGLVRRLRQEKARPPRWELLWAAWQVGRLRQGAIFIRSVRALVPILRWWLVESLVARQRVPQRVRFSVVGARFWPKI